MQLSRLEDQKKKGHLDLNFLKRNKKQPANGDRSDEIKLDPSLVPVDFKKRGGGLQPIYLGAQVSPSAKTFQTGNPSMSNLPPSALDGAEMRELEMETFEKPNFASPSYPQTTKYAKKQPHRNDDYETLLEEMDLPQKT
jgi:hypothetical protein